MTHTPHRLEVENISVAYGDRIVLNEVSFQVPHGARIAVVGPNGAGKSTLFKAMVGLLPLKTGRILIHGLPLGNHKDCVAYIPQREEVDWRFPVTVGDVVMMGRFNTRGWFARPNRADQEIVERSLTEMGIASLAKTSISDLSGGQQQRVFLARALAQEPHILLMDEPFNGIDVTTQNILFDLLEGLRKQHVTVIVSTHDLTMAAQRFDRILLIKRRLIAYGTAENVFSPDAIREAFGGQMLYLDGAVVVDQCCPDDDHDHPAES